MPRSSRSSRPAARPAAPKAAPVQHTRGAHTSAATPAVAGQHAQPPAVHQPQQPGMMAQMAATAGSVAIGSTLGHGLSNMLFGGRSQEVAAPAQEAPVQQQGYAPAPTSCDAYAKNFTKCLDATSDVSACNYYLEQLKACQAAAAPY